MSHFLTVGFGVGEQSRGFLTIEKLLRLQDLGEVMTQQKKTPTPQDPQFSTRGVSQVLLCTHVE